MYNNGVTKQRVERRQFLRIVSVGGGMLALDVLIAGCGQIITRNTDKAVPLVPTGVAGAKTRLEKALSKLDPAIVTEACTASKSFLQVTMGNQRGKGKISETSRNFYIKANRFIDHLDGIGLLGTLEDEGFAIIEPHEQEKVLIEELRSRLIQDFKDIGLLDPVTRVSRLLAQLGDKNTVSKGLEIIQQQGGYSKFYRELIKEVTKLALLVSQGGGETDAVYCAPESVERYLPQFYMIPQCGNTPYDTSTSDPKGGNGSTSNCAILAMLGTFAIGVSGFVCLVGAIGCTGQAFLSLVGRIFGLTAAGCGVSAAFSDE